MFLTRSSTIRCSDNGTPPVTVSCSAAPNTSFWNSSKVRHGRKTVVLVNTAEYSTGTSIEGGKGDGGGGYDAHCDMEKKKTTSNRRGGFKTTLNYTINTRILLIGL